MGKYVWGTISSHWNNWSQTEGMSSQNAEEWKAWGRSGEEVNKITQKVPCFCYYQYAAFSGVIQTRMACKGNSFEKVLKHGALFTEWYYQNDSLKGNVKDIFGEGTGCAKDRDKDTSVLPYCTLR